jgi:hypothetical protein
VYFVIFVVKKPFLPGAGFTSNPAQPIKKGNRMVAFFLVHSVKKKLPAVASAAITIAAATATTTAAIATAAEAFALRHRLGLVDGQGAPIELGAVQAIDGFLRLAAGTHLDEAETPRLARELVGNHTGGFHRAMLRKDFLQTVAGYRIWQTTDI